ARAAAAEILAFGVFAENDEIDGRLGQTQRGEIGSEELHRPEIHIEIESKSETQKNVARVLVARHARIAKCPEKDRVDVIAQMPERVLGQSFFCVQIVIC